MPTSGHRTVDLFKPAFSKLGYNFESFTLSNKNYTKFISPGGGSWLTRNAIINYPFVNVTSRVIADNKDLAYELCQKNGIRIPKTVRFTDITAHRSELGNLLAGGPVVVKPNDSRLSWGVTLNVRSREALETAVTEAKQFSDIIIAQEQVKGQEVRFAVMDGVVKAALLRQTPRVVGDGKHTLQELIDVENTQRSKLRFPYVTYPLLDEKLIDYTQFDISGIPSEDEIIELNRSAMIRGGASMYNVFDTVDDSYKSVAEKAARALGTQFTVVDVMIEDLQTACTDDNYAFIEFNSAPAIGLFYSCRDGKQYDVIAELVPRIDALLKVRNV